jgi:hypothetical protein
MTLDSRRALGLPFDPRSIGTARGSRTSAREIERECYDGGHATETAPRGAPLYGAAQTPGTAHYSAVQDARAPVPGRARCKPRGDLCAWLSLATINTTPALCIVLCLTRIQFALMV